MASASRIPLKCDLCPKKPRFSDVSHLLTHISSKSHLSNNFKTRVRADVDTDSRRLIEDYDQWYAEWNIQDLLADRMSQKDKGLTTTRSRARGPQGNKSMGSRNKRSMANVPVSATSVGSAASGFIKQEEGSPAMPPAWAYTVAHGQLPNHAHLNHSTQFPPQTYQPAHGSFQYGAPQYQWYSMPSNGHVAPTHGYPEPSQHSMTSVTLPSNNAVNAAKDRKAKIIANRQILEVRRRHGTSTSGSVVEDVTSTDDSTKTVPQEPDPEADRIGSPSENCPSVAIKGAPIPNVLCFDAAPPIKRQQRNQKKTDEEYALLQTTSEKTALWKRAVVYSIKDGQWHEVKNREITGNPSPSSIASSSRSRSPGRRQSPRNAIRRGGRRIVQPRQRGGRRPVTRVEDGVDSSLTHHIARGPQGRMPIYTGSEQDESMSTRSWQPTNWHASACLNQENETQRRDSALPLQLTKFEDQDSYDDEHALQSIETHGITPINFTAADVSNRLDRVMTFGNVNQLNHTPVVLPPPAQLPYRTGLSPIRGNGTYSQHSHEPGTTGDFNRRFGPFHSNREQSSYSNFGSIMSNPNNLAGHIAINAWDNYMDQLQGSPLRSDQMHMPTFAHQPSVMNDIQHSASNSWPLNSRSSRHDSHLARPLAASQGTAMQTAHSTHPSLHGLNHDFGSFTPSKTAFPQDTSNNWTQNQAPNALAFNPTFSTGQMSAPSFSPVRATNNGYVAQMSLPTASPAPPATPVRMQPFSLPLSRHSSHGQLDFEPPMRREGTSGDTTDDGRTLTAPQSPVTGA